MKPLIGFFAILFVLSGCAGTKFTRIPNEHIKLGWDTLSSIQRQLGKPYQEATVIKNGKTMEVLTYSFAKPSFASTFGKPVPSRSQTFYFHENILVGQNYTSTEAEDQTDFDSSIVDKIKENVTEVDEVLALLGPPSGEYIYPLVEKTSERAFVYSYIQVKSGFTKMNVYQQLLVVTFDPNRVVTKLEFVESGKK